MPQGIEFNEWRPPREIKSRSRMIVWVQEHSGGLLSSDKAAGIFLIAFVIINFLLAYWLFTSF